MAKVYGLTGKMSGKMGSAVFAVRKGQQIMRQYNPIVLNPKSAKQQDSRVKFKLGTQLAAIMSPGFGTMIPTKRKVTKGTPSKRNAFVQENYSLITTQEMGELGVVAQIDMERLQLTTSSRNDLPIPNVEVDATWVDVMMQNVPLDITLVRFVIVGYVPGEIEHTEQPYIISIVDAQVDKSKNDAFVALDGLEGRPKIAPETRLTVLAYGLIPTSAAAADRLGNLFAPQAEFVSAVQLDNLVREGAMVETKTKGFNYIPA